MLFFFICDAEINFSFIRNMILNLYFNHKLGISLYALNTTYFDLLFLFENAGNEHVQSWRIHYIIGNIIDSSLHLKLKEISMIITLRKCYSAPNYNYQEI